MGWPSDLKSDRTGCGCLVLGLVLAPALVFALYRDRDEPESEETEEGGLLVSAVPIEKDPRLGPAKQVPPLSQISKGHTKAVMGLDHSPDGESLLSVSLDGSVRVWILGTEDDPSKVRDGSEAWNDALWMPDGRRVILAGEKGVHVVSLQTRTDDYTFSEHTKSVVTVRLQPGGDMIASAGADGFVRLWRPGSGQVHALRHGEHAVLGLAWTLDGRRVLSGGQDNRIALWNAETGERIATLTGQRATINDIVVDPGGDRFYAASDDGSIFLWHLDERRLLGRFDHHTDEVWALATTRDGKIVVSSSKDGTLVWFRPDRPEPLLRQAAGMNGVVAMDFGPGDETLVTSGVWNTISVWPVPNLEGELPPRAEGDAGTPR